MTFLLTLSSSALRAQTLTQVGELTAVHKAEAHIHVHERRAKTFGKHGIRTITAVTTAFNGVFKKQDVWKTIGLLTFLDFLCEDIAQTIHLSL